MSDFLVTVEYKPLSVTLNGEKLYRRYIDCSRMLFVGKDYVVKLEDEDDYYFSQCRREFDMWRNLIEQKDRRYFVEILQYGRLKKYDYIVQRKFPYLRFVPSPDSIWKYKESWDSVICKMKEKYDLNDLSEDTPSNWTLYRGSPLIIDYGV